MLSRPITGRDAPWQERFRAATAWGRTAPGAPERSIEHQERMLRFAYRVLRGG